MTDSLIQKLWSYCDTLRDDGVSYGDYVEQLTFLLFLKMAHEYNKPPHNRDIKIPGVFNWESLIDKKGAALEEHYYQLLTSLGKEKGMLGQIFTKAENKIHDPAKLSRLINMIDKEDWVVMDSDVKGRIYEGLLEKNAQDIKTGAGQYFTPRPLIKVMVGCVAPEPQKSIADPACGTGGFFLGAYDYLKDQVKSSDEKKFLKKETFFGWELVPSAARLCLMNLLLHNIGEMDAESSIIREDSLLSEPKTHFDYVITNPPFGKKSTVKLSIEEENAANKEDNSGNVKRGKQSLTYNRQSFWHETSNKQLNFVQHIVTMLKATGQASVVLPDNVLFEGGAGETIRKKLMEKCNLHTILRLPTGIFYAHGVKANVIFFDAKPAAKTPWTKEVWFYDYRTNVHHTLKKTPLSYEDLKEFITCYQPNNLQKRKETWSENNPDGRWRKYTYDEIIARDKTSLDIFWLKDDSLSDLENLPDPDELALEIVENLEAGLASFREIVETLNND